MHLSSNQGTSEIPILLSPRPNLMPVISIHSAVHAEPYIFHHTAAGECTDAQLTPHRIVKTGIWQLREIPFLAKPVVSAQKNDHFLYGYRAGSVIRFPPYIIKAL